MLASSPEGFPDEYVRLLNEMGRDPATSAAVRHALRKLGDQAFYERVMPVPVSWLPDDFELFCIDHRVRRAEYARRCAEAIDDWRECSQQHVSWTLEEHTVRRIQEWTREQLLSEIGAWLRLNPGVKYDEGPADG